MDAHLLTRGSYAFGALEGENLAVHSTARLPPLHPWSIGVVDEQGINIPLPLTGVSIEQFLRRSGTTFGNSLK